jgi:hypothetical protein
MKRQLKWHIPSPSDQEPFHRRDKMKRQLKRHIPSPSTQQPLPQTQQNETTTKVAYTLTINSTTISTDATEWNDNQSGIYPHHQIKNHFHRRNKMKRQLKWHIPSPSDQEPLPRTQQNETTSRCCIWTTIVAYIWHYSGIGLEELRVSLENLSGQSVSGHYSNLAPPNYLSEALWLEQTRPVLMYPWTAHKHIE